MRQRAGALYIKDKKLFLICEGGQPMHWTPGGGLEEGETFEQALERELSEELDAQLHSARLFVRIHDGDADEEVRYFLVDMTVPENLPNDTTSIWYGKDDHQANTLPISKRIYTKVFPKLIAENLV